VEWKRVDSWKKKTALFLGSQMISLFGSSIVQYAIMWHITLQTASGVMMTLILICGFIPTFLLLPFAGVWADRYNRKLLIAAADGMIAAATLVMALLFLMGYGSLWLLFVMSAIRAVGSAIQTPAVSAFLPQMVPQDRLTRVNGINGSLLAANMLVAPMVSVALLSVTTLEIIFFVDVCTAAVAIFILLAWLRVPAHRKAAASRQIGYLDDLKQGFVYIRDHAFLKPFFLCAAFVFVFTAPAAFLTPLQVTRSFGADEWRLGAIEVAFSLGMLIGGGVIAAWGGFRNRMHTIAFACAAFGVCTMLLGVVPSFWIYLAIMAVTGLVMPMLETPVVVLLQEKVEPDYHGRVFGVFNMISTSVMPLAMLVYGPIADVIRIERLLILTGIALTSMVVLLLGNKRLIRAGEPSVKEGSASHG
jgi:DHA3 family macrolide efflux protein-like MFS transporter